MSSIPYNYHKYLDDVTKMRQRGAISSGEQIKSPSSAGSRGLAKLDQFTRDANQMMKGNITESATREYKNLDKKSIEQLREKYLPDWEYKDNSLQKRYKFEDYYETIKFLINTVKPQEELDHHADIAIFFDEVLVKVYTHRTNDVSDFDFKLALQMDMIAKEKHGAIEPSYGLDKLLK
ncbi:MAG: 4a-hydroxytetrahydrobiopterin dehydratase [Pelagibacteraceae bacterium TMED232]|jgi:4a-hydroxytetrahydrobiopterin dehydratase|nr:MAG: 4a-hydroxytetrahydrobiopterin dehydratase [Pelagibacteraceae bacterium TMED232]|tara:strand:- start:314 stop:847 length:534 start_codon:yes stop_codon:yes gene_type:complete